MARSGYFSRLSPYVKRLTHHRQSGLRLVECLQAERGRLTIRAQGERFACELWARLQATPVAEVTSLKPRHPGDPVWQDIFQATPRYGGRQLGSRTVHERPCGDSSHPKKRQKPLVIKGFRSETGGTRTRDPRIKSPLHCQLCYGLANVFRMGLAPMQGAALPLPDWVVSRGAERHCRLGNSTPWMPAHKPVAEA